MTGGEMRRLVVAACGGLLLVACASTVESRSACEIVGTYSMTTTPETATSGCPAPTPATVTISRSRADLFAVEIQGLVGACTATAISECKVQSKCDIEIPDPVNEAAKVGTFQISWSFDASGFSGTNSGSFPKAQSLPDGCDFISKATGMRR